MSESKTIGYWRPYSRKTRGVIQQPDYEYYRGLLDDAERVARGEHAALYISEAVMRVRGIETKEQYLRALADEARDYADREFALPVPVPESLDAERAVKLSKWLQGYSLSINYRGSSLCRICGEINGCMEYGRDGYYYPAGLIHYVRDHRCAVPGLPDEVWDV